MCTAWHHVLTNSEHSVGCSTLVPLNGPWGEKPQTNEQKTRANICDFHFTRSVYSCALSLSPARLPLRVHASLCLLVNDSQRERLIDMCAAKASTSIHTCRDLKETAPYTCTHTQTHAQMTVRHGIVRDTPVTFCHDVWLTEDGTFPFLQHVLYDYKTMAMHESTGFCPRKEFELGYTILELFSEGLSFIV